ncbi:MAG: type II glyceraldehyde-3-phosphate dehydrogenase [Thermoplasmata archaeon]|nr:type II glyceraldehyde-3-phosphate dehydrogenase [Thermoplasmata archaeon]
MKVKVAINGYGTIGKRVADAVSLQDDMEVVGVTKTRPTVEALHARERGYPLYAAKEEAIEGFENAGMKIEGALEDLLQRADVVVDCSPGKVGATYKPLYEKAGVKAIFQGGEKHEVAGVSFNAYANYEEAWGRRFVRVVSCNTTALVRSLYPLKKEVGVEEVQAVMIRRAADPWDSSKGPINAIEPSLKLPSHHGPDVQTVIPDLNIYTVAVKVPTTIMHLHSIIVKLPKEVGEEEILSLWERYPRISFVSGALGVKSTAKVMEMARDMLRPRGDMYETIIWRDAVKIVNRTLYYFQAVHQESDVVPENIDAIRSMFEMADKEESIRKTDKTLGVGWTLS